MEVAKLCCVNFTKLSLVTPNGIRTRTAKIVATWLARRHDLTCVGHKLHQSLETENKRLITEGPKAGLNLNEKNNAKLTRTKVTKRLVGRKQDEKNKKDTEPRQTAEQSSKPKPVLVNGYI